MKDAHAELDDVHGSAHQALTAALVEVAAESVRFGAKPGPAQRRLAGLLAQAGAAADLLGRRRLALEVEALQGSRFSAGATTVAFLPGSVPFDEAADAILRRLPVLAPGWERARDAWEARGFALARAASETIAQRVQETIVRSIREGTDAFEAQDQILAAIRSGGITAPRSYAETVFRTITTSAYTEGRFDAAREPDLAAVVGGFRFVATDDPDVRANHLAADGFVAAVDDPVWKQLRPPLGYNCRCAVEMVGKREALQVGAIAPDGAVRPRRAPAGAGPDVGFRP